MKPFITTLVRSLALCAALWLTVAPLNAADTEAAEATALRLVPQQEKDGYEFRSELWTNELTPDVGRAVRRCGPWRPPVRSVAKQRGGRPGQPTAKTSGSRAGPRLSRTARPRRGGEPPQRDAKPGEAHGGDPPLSAVSPRW